MLQCVQQNVRWTELGAVELDLARGCAPVLLHREAEHVCIDRESKRLISTLQLRSMGMLEIEPHLRVTTLMPLVAAVARSD